MSGDSGEGLSTSFCADPIKDPNTGELIIKVCISDGSADLQTFKFQSEEFDYLIATLEKARSKFRLAQKRALKKPR